MVNLLRRTWTSLPVCKEEGRGFRVVSLEPIHLILSGSLLTQLILVQNFL